MPAADPSLSQTDLRRLEKLASVAGRTPRAMLKFVLRDGFTETERVVRAVQTGRADVRAGRLAHMRRSWLRPMRSCRAMPSHNKPFDWSATAVRELIDGLIHIAEDNPQGARLVKSRFDRAGRFLELNPRIGKPGIKTIPSIVAGTRAGNESSAGLEASRFCRPGEQE